MTSKDFADWGIRIRTAPDKGYYALWDRLRTIRLDLGTPGLPLDIERPEFVDIGITERCNAKCPFCYVSAGPAGHDYQGIVDTWKSWIAGFQADKALTPAEDPILLDCLSLKGATPGTPEFEESVRLLAAYRRAGATLTEKPFQVAIGSVGEPTVHPELPEFLEAVWSDRVVPNYTTNGIVLASDTSVAERIMEATRKYVGGVAVSFGNHGLREKAKVAVQRLVDEGNCKVMIHEIIGSRSDVDDLFRLDQEHGDHIHYHVLLPLMAHGRSGKSMDDDTYLYLVDRIRESGNTNLAFGANFLPFLRKYPGSLSVWDYPEETYSKNILLRPGEVVITPNSFRLTPERVLKFEDNGNERMAYL